MGGGDPEAVADVAADWPVAEAGVPPRAVKAASREGIRTVGELRKAIGGGKPGIRGLGAATRRELDTFFRLAAEVLAGRHPFGRLCDVLEHFAGPAGRDAVERRYGLLDPSAGAVAPDRTLRAVGIARGVTRERARQTIEGAVANLGSRLSLACMAPATDGLGARIEAQGGGVTAVDLAAFGADGFLADYQAAAVLPLLRDCGAPFARRNGFWFALGELALAAAEKRCLDLLDRPDATIPLDRLVEAAGAAVPPPVVARLIEARGDVAITTDGRCFLPRRGAAALVEERLRALGGAARYRDLQREYNAAIRHGRRVGFGSVLRILADPARFRRLDDGRYEVARP